jgi:hypothetical protein
LLEEFGPTLLGLHAKEDTDADTDAGADADADATRLTVVFADLPL